MQEKMKKSIMVCNSDVTRNMTHRFLYKLQIAGVISVSILFGILFLVPEVYSASSADIPTYNNDYWDTGWNIGSTGGDLADVQYYSGGNESQSYSGGNSYFAEVTGGTQFFSNCDGTYNTITVQPSYSSGDSCSGGSLSSSCGDGPTPPPPVCPPGYTLFQSNQCCPSQYYKVVDTNGSKKGGKVAQCNIPKDTVVTGPDEPEPVVPTTTSCTVNGTSVRDGDWYTFYRESSVPYNGTCEEVERLCVNGTFSGDANTFSQCEVGDAPEISGIWIKAQPPVVRYDGSSTISWDGGNAEACTVKGWSLESSEKTNTSGTEITDFQGESIYTLTCTLGPNTKVETTTVKVLPRTQET
jgi:hypothetical protein